MVLDKFIRAFAETEGLIIDDGILLYPKTIELVNEIEEMSRHHLIDKALATGNRDLFMQLTNQKEEIS